MSVHDDARRLVERTTVAQGLPARVEDPAVLDQIAAVLPPPRARQGEQHAA